MTLAVGFAIFAVIMRPTLETKSWDSTDPEDNAPDWQLSNETDDWLVNPPWKSPRKATGTDSSDA